MIQLLTNSKFFKPSKIIYSKKVYIYIIFSMKIAQNLWKCLSSYQTKLLLISFLVLFLGPTMSWGEGVQSLSLWVLWCARLLDWEKDLLQTGQGKICSQLWVRWCDFRLKNQENYISQNVQSKTFYLEWVLLWTFSADNYS